jgi:hypothetical protein
VQHASRIVAPNTSTIQVFMLVRFGNVSAVLGSTHYCYTNFTSFILFLGGFNSYWAHGIL